MITTREALTQAEGYPIVEDRSPNVPDEDKEDIPLGLTIHLISPPDQATPTEAQYGWHPTVDNNGTHAEAHVFQNARTGEIERIRVESGGPIRDAPEEATNGTPGASLASIVFASVLGAVLLAARRRR